MDTSEQFAQADQDWTFGFLAEARAGYQRIHAADPTSWKAAFQLAWIDAAFASLPPERIDALDRPDLSPTAKQRLAMLRTPVPLLSGTVDAWSISRLRALPEAGTAAWWEKQAALTGGARQYGLAMACFREAEHLDPARYYDQPRAMQTLPLQVEQHLAAARG